MVTIGSLSWTAKVDNVGEAQGKANDLADSMEEADDKANNLNESTDGTTSKLGGMAGGALANIRRMTTLSGVLGLVTSAVWLLSAQITGLIAKFGGLAALTATITGGLQFLLGIGAGFISWLAAGSAGALGFAAAIGVVLGLLGVWILHVTGALDAVKGFGSFVRDQLPAWVADGFMVLVSVIVGPLAVIGGFILGFVEGFIEGGLVQGIQTGIDRAGDVLGIFGDAWSNTLGRVKDLVGDAVGWIGDKWDGLVETTKSMASGMTDAVTDGVAGAWNTVIPDTVGFPSVELPSVTIDAGPLGSTDVGGQTVFEGFSFGLPQLQSGGLIESAGAAMLHKDELVVPAEVTRNISGETDALGGGEGVTIQELTVEIGDQALDLSTLTLTEMEELARLIAEETGREVETII